MSLHGCDISFMPRYTHHVPVARLSTLSLACLGVVFSHCTVIISTPVIVRDANASGTVFSATTVSALGRARGQS